jgi:hypothetical protein
LLRRHAERRQVPPQRFESFAVLQTDQVLAWAKTPRGFGRLRLEPARA